MYTVCHSTFAVQWLLIGGNWLYSAFHGFTATFPAREGSCKLHDYNEIPQLHQHFTWEHRPPEIPRNTKKSSATEIHRNHFGLDLQREQWHEIVHETATVVIVNFPHLNNTYFNLGNTDIQYGLWNVKNPQTNHWYMYHKSEYET